MGGQVLSCGQFPLLSPAQLGLEMAASPIDRTGLIIYHKAALWPTFGRFFRRDLQLSHCSEQVCKLDQLESRPTSSGQLFSTRPAATCSASELNENKPATRPASARGPAQFSSVGEKFIGLLLTSCQWCPMIVSRSRAQPPAPSSAPLKLAARPQRPSCAAQTG